MTDPFEKHRTDTLILLVGGNPLPNYVAAHLLSHPQSQLVLIHSEGTKDQARRIEQVLRGEGRTQIELKDVNESDPASICKSVKDAAKKYSSGSIGLNYTGGTKAMAVHAYRALEQTDRQAIFSYLDARSLSMVISGQRTPIKINQQVQVSLETLLKLHNQPFRGNLVHEQRIDKPETIKVLVSTFADVTKRQSFREWLEVNSPNLETTIGMEIRAAFARDSSSFDTKWLRGFWLEEYIFDSIQKLKLTEPQLAIGSLAMNIKPVLVTSGKGDNFEFDVGFMRGHQFYGISASTAQKFGDLKQKLFEVSVRARQLGGTEARYALVSCVDPADAGNLKEQMKGLEIYEHIRVFSESDLRTLQDKLKQWIKRS